MTTWTSFTGPTIQEELSRLRQRECILHEEIEMEKARMKAKPKDLDAIKCWANLSELRSDCLKAIGELALAPGGDFEPPKAHSGGEEGNGA